MNLLLYDGPLRGRVEERHSEGSLFSVKPLASLLSSLLNGCLTGRLDLGELNPFGLSASYDNGSMPCKSGSGAYPIGRFNSSILLNVIDILRREVIEKKVK